MKNQKSNDMETKGKNQVNDKVNNSNQQSTSSNMRNYVSGDSTPSSSGHKFSDNKTNK